MSFMIAVYLLRSSAAKLATDIVPALQPFPASFSLWQMERPIHLCTSTPSCQRCRTMSHRPPRMESLWARSRTTTTAVSSSPPRKSPKACRTRASSGRLTTQTHSHNQGESRSSLDSTFLSHQVCWTIWMPLLVGSKAESACIAWPCKIYSDTARSFRWKNIRSVNFFKTIIK